MRGVAGQWLRDILLAMFQRPATTRAEILRATGLNPASASHALQHLLRCGAVLKIGALEPNGGRSPDLLRLNPDAAYFVAVDLESVPPRVALCSLGGEIRYRWPIHASQPGNLTVGDILEGIRAVVERCDPWQAQRVIAAGIAVPGIIDAAGRITAVNLGWRNLPVIEPLQQAGMPVFLDVDSRISVVAERTFGAARGCENFVYLEAGRGVGIGVFADGRHVGGRDGMAGEFGHMTIDPRAQDPCRCGKRGCLDAIASAPNIVRQYCEAARLADHRIATVGIQDVLDAARKGDAEALRVIGRAGMALGLGLSYVVHLFNPELIVVGGDLAEGMDLLRPHLQRQLETHALPEMAHGVRIVTSELGADMRLRGAAGIAFQRCLSDPVLLKKLCAPGAIRTGRLRSSRSVRGQPAARP